MKNNINNKKGTTLIELLIYIGIFLVITPVLLTFSIDAASRKQQHSSEKQVNADSQYIMERIYNAITDAKKVDVNNSTFDTSPGKLTLVKQDGSNLIIELNTTNNNIQITEDEVKSTLSPSSTEVKTLYFENIPGSPDPSIVLGVTVRMSISEDAVNAVTQNYLTSANLRRGDYDDDDCLDYMDQFPKHATCCGDADADGACDELDNCVLTFNPFQEDGDSDNIGDACDNSYGECADFQTESAYNCSTGLVALVNQVPPIPTGILKNILMSASPLSPTVLQAVIDRDPAMSIGNLRQIFIFNTKLLDYDPTDIYQNVLNMGLPPGTTNQIVAAQLAAEDYAWQGEGEPGDVIYDAEINEDERSVKFDDANYPLGEETSNNATDVFIVNATIYSGSDPVTVTTKTSNNTDINTVSVAGDSFTDSMGFQVELACVNDGVYTFRVSNISNTRALESIEFNFGENSEVTAPTGPQYTVSRYIYYCPGGCSTNCGDTGTGVITNGIITDQCYKSDSGYPEWCYKWLTNTDTNDNSESPAYVGGTQSGEMTLYWEKEFKVLLSSGQISNLSSITLDGEVAYQSTTQFFCDVLSSSCPMRGTLVGGQDVELYDWTTSTWTSIGVMGLDGTDSDQQHYEITYSGANPQNFIGGTDNKIIKARMKFKWNGVPYGEQTTAPAFMLIDYFSLHLKW